MAEPLKIPLDSVKSSYIRELGYHPESKTMAVRFQSGKVFHYSNVEQSHFDALKAAESIGAHFHQNFRGQSEVFPHKEFVE